MCCPAPLACPPPPTCRACRRRAVLGVRTSEMPRHAPPRHGEAGAPPTCAAKRRRYLPLCFPCVCVVCPASHPHPTSILCTRHAESPCLEPANSGGCLWCVTVYSTCLARLLAREACPVCRGCARARCPVFPRPLLSTFPPRAPASSQPSSGGAACGASPHTAHAFGPPPSTRGMLVLGMRPRAVPRVFPPSSFHVPPAWSVSSSLGSLLTYAPVPFLRVACPPGRP